MASPSTPLEQLNAACEGFRETLPRLIRSMDDSTSSRNDVMKALCLLKNIKQSTRDTFLDAEVYRRRVAEQKDLVEAHHLKLQNLMYEKDHLLREIKRCRGFPTQEMDKIEFKNGPLPVTVDADRHAEHLQRLDEEMKYRQEILQQQRDIKDNISNIDEAIQNKQAILERVPVELGLIEKATLPLQNLLSIQVSATHERQQDSKKLSTPLYILFCELEAYTQVHGGLTLSITNSKSISKKKLQSRKHAEEPQQKRQKITSRSPSPATIDHPTQESKELTYDPSPYALVVEITIDQQRIKVYFQYIPSLKVIVVETPKYPHILRNLFADDNGQVDPNPSNFYAFQCEDGNEMETDFPHDSKARPYLWAQWICGFHYGKRSEYAIRPEPAIRQVVAKLRQRCEAHVLLHQLLDQLKDKTIPVHAAASLTWAAPSRTTKLDSWTKVHHDSKLFPNAPEGSMYYRAMLYYPNSGRIVVYVEISPAYPRDIPRIVCQNEKDSAAVPTPSQLKDMEIEVHLYANELVTEENRSYLLAHQLCRLEICLDTIHSGEEYSFGKQRHEESG